MHTCITFFDTCLMYNVIYNCREINALIILNNCEAHSEIIITKMENKTLYGLSIKHFIKHHNKTWFFFLIYKIYLLEHTYKNQTNTKLQLKKSKNICYSNNCKSIWVSQLRYHKEHSEFIKQQFSINQLAPLIMYNIKFRSFVYVL